MHKLVYIATKCEDSPIDEILECYGPDCGNCWEEDEYGFCRYNSAQQWDWYEIGGRWENCLLTRNLEHVSDGQVKDLSFGEGLSPAPCDLVCDGDWLQDFPKEMFFQWVEAHPDYWIHVVDCHF